MERSLCLGAWTWAPVSVNFAFECGMVQIRERDVSPATVKVQLRLDPKARTGPSSGNGGP